MNLLEARNPTCDLRTYVGGLSTCHHGWLLLDADQEPPWQDQPLVYYKKYRVWFQEYTPATPPERMQPSHVNILRADWGVGADYDHSEYDVIQCPKGTPKQQCHYVATGTWRPLPPATKESDKQYLVLVHHHCHAPTCLKIELWNNDTGKLLCRQVQRAHHQRPLNATNVLLPCLPSCSASSICRHGVHRLQ